MVEAPRRLNASFVDSSGPDDFALDLSLQTVPRFRLRLTLDHSLSADRERRPHGCCDPGRGLSTFPDRPHGRGSAMAQRKKRGAARKAEKQQTPRRPRGRTRFPDETRVEDRER